MLRKYYLFQVNNKSILKLYYQENMYVHDMFFLIVSTTKQHFFKSKESFSRCRLVNQDFSLITNQSIFSSTEKKYF